jgi:subtilisin family serine protease
MQMGKLDPALARAYAGFLARRGAAAGGAAAGGAAADSVGTDAAMSVVLSFHGDLDVVAAAGFAVEWAGAGQAVGVVRMDALPAIADLPEVDRIVAGKPPTPQLDTAAVEIEARAGDEGGIGTQGLWHAAGGVLAGASRATGKDVIVAVIDSGIDVGHPAFCTQVQPYKTRILKVWDQGLDPAKVAGAAGPPVERLASAHTYGVEFDTKAIEDALAASKYPARPLDFPHKDCEGHGTHVAATAAGGPLEVGRPRGSYIGVAPEASILVVKLLDVPETIRNTEKLPVAYATRCRDALFYALREARAQGRPVVINASFRNELEPGDGLSLDDRFLSDTFDPSHAPDDDHFPAGAILVKSAGNEGDPGGRGFGIVTIPDAGSISVPLELFDSRGAQVFKTVNCVRQPFIPPLFVMAWYGDVTVTAAVCEPDATEFSKEVGPGERATGLFNGGNEWELEQGSEATVRRTPDGAVIIRRRYALLEVRPKSSFDRRESEHRLGPYDVRFTGPPGTVLYTMCQQLRSGGGAIGLRFATAYRDGTPLPGPEPVNGSNDPVELIEVTGRHTIADSGGPRVITVGAYDDQSGEIAAFSSRGPLRDYADPPLGPVADKPDVAAPGVGITAALSQDRKDGVGRRLTRRSLEGNRFTEMRGTSMAAPMVAGTVALMLQKNPNLTVDQARAALTAGATPRAGTEPAPDDPGYTDAFGSGRVGALGSHDSTP